jgi:hypothetical protein
MATVRASPPIRYNIQKRGAQLCFAESTDVLTAGEGVTHAFEKKNMKEGTVREK